MRRFCAIEGGTATTSPCRPQAELIYSGLGMLGISTWVRPKTRYAGVSPHRAGKGLRPMIEPLHAPVQTQPGPYNAAPVEPPLQHQAKGAD